MCVYLIQPLAAIYQIPIKPVCMYGETVQIAGYVNNALLRGAVASGCYTKETAERSTSQISTMDTRHLLERQSTKGRSHGEDSAAETGTYCQGKKTDMVWSRLMDETTGAALHDNNEASAKVTTKYGRR